MSEIISKRYEFTLLFDVENGNPNGDPDAGNMPRIDAETGYGIVTDVCLKRKIRNYIDCRMNDAPNYKIYVKENVPLDTNRKYAYETLGIEPPKDKQGKVSADEPNKEEFLKVNRFMCDNFYDIRAFGAVMTLKYNCGQVRGPVQLSFAKSIDVICPQELSITSCTYANEGEKSSKMGNKKIVPYALYRCDGYVSANLAKKTTGFTEEDLNLLWEAMINMFEMDHSAARGKMATRQLIVFEHENELGNCPAFELFDTVHIEKTTEGSPRSYHDYQVSIDEEAIPSQVKVIKKI